MLENPLIFGKIVSNNINSTDNDSVQAGASVPTSEEGQDYKYLYFVVHDWVLASYLIPWMRKQWIVNIITTPEGKKFRCKVGRGRRKPVDV